MSHQGASSGHQAIIPSNAHLVSGRALLPPFPQGYEQIVFGLGCFWGAERLFWQAPGVWVTAVGYAGGIAENPRYKQVCSGVTGHAEVVLLVYNASECDLVSLLKIFWQAHDPTQGMRQGNDVGSQYRSVVYWTNQAQRMLVEKSHNAYAQALKLQGYGDITTEMGELHQFYYAEDEHQQYLARNPQGYCGLRGTGVDCSW